MLLLRSARIPRHCTTLFSSSLSSSSFSTAPPPPHKKLSVTNTSSPNVHLCPKENLNVVFKPGAYGGQLMAQSLTAAINTAPESHTPSSLQCFFLGPTLISSDVYFTTSLIRESGKSFQTFRTVAQQLAPEENIEDLPSKPVNFESTVSFYKTLPQPDDYTAMSPHLNDSPLTSSDFQTSLSLSDVSASIKSGFIPRNLLYKMALKLTQSCTADMQLTIRLPSNPDLNTGKTAYFIGVPSTMQGDSLTSLKTLIPYVSDSMTQVLSACDALDPVWSGWPSKLTVWNYSINYHVNSSNNVSPSEAFVDDEGTRWFVIEYVFAGARNGIGNGFNHIWDLDGSLLSTSSFQVLASPPKE
ncbi:hypothetical protein TrLO_g2186 [Triparma laevis f. longispina]|uniref:Acyl-CoA thioesterase-like N-terminal HotDog domain-containing protein n=1 Tax=Triparma laevis f. longispina TaxID=1714387 RepID=A0A9W7DXB9_9STRA|nr:hypothetical protein TrLO_g2186 [Triparma laevis f. longispina]